MEPEMNEKSFSKPEKVRKQIDSAADYKYT